MKNYNMKNHSYERLYFWIWRNFSEKWKRLLELEIRTVLTRKEHRNKLDIKHVEHTKYPCEDLDSKNLEKEYTYGQFVITEGNLYFSDTCVENDKVMQSPIVNTIYNSLDDEDMLIDEDTTAKNRWYQYWLRSRHLINSLSWSLPKIFKNCARNVI